MMKIVKNRVKKPWTNQTGGGGGGGVLPEGLDDRGSEGDGEKAEKVGTVWTSDQDEQIAAFFEEHTLFYNMSNMEYKNKKKRDNLLLELARTMFETGKLAI